MLQKPQSLKKGDTVALITPAGRIDEKKFLLAKKNIESLGLNIHYSGKIFSKYGYLAGTDKERLEDLHYAFKNPEIKAIFCIRGGYGATRILDKIDYNLIRNNPKFFIGYSDITALHSAFLVKSNLIGIHGIVASSKFSDYTRRQLSNLLFEKNQNYNLPCEWGKIIAHGNGRGTIVGGNLSLLTSLTGTQYLPNFEGKIVFIEETSEPPYKIDRMLTHLLTATKLKLAEAVIFGTFYKCTPNNFDININNTLTIEQIIEEKFYDFDKPVLYGLNFGHIENSCIFPIGVEACVNTDLKEIIILENINQ